jgi:hypothetical protein
VIDSYNSVQILTRACRILHVCMQHPAILHQQCAAQTACLTAVHHQTLQQLHKTLLLRLAAEGVALTKVTEKGGTLQ